MTTRKFAIIAVAVALVVIGLFALLQKEHRDPLAPIEGQINVFFFDVGQGDCILIDYGEFECLIDGGPTGTFASAFLNPYIDGPLEHLVLTHPHADHYGGFGSVFSTYTVENFWWNGEVGVGKTWVEVEKRIDAEPEMVKHTAPAVMATGAFDLQCINGRDFDTNNNSLVLRLTFRDITYLFMGDVEAEGEEYLLPTLSDIDVLKVGHHGSCTSSSVAFLNVVQPEIAVYSCGVDNRYGHPCAATLTNLESFGAKIYGTDVDGTVRISTDGHKLYVKTGGKL